MTKPISLLGLLSVLCLATPALAQPGPSGRADRDPARNHRMKKLLQRFDANHDGVFGPAERRAMRIDRVKRRLARKDTDHDGRLSWPEVAPKRPERARVARRRFGRVDRNRDGYLERSELVAAARKLARRRHQCRQGNRPAAPPAAR